MNPPLAIVFFLSLTIAHSEKVDYFWRDYTGEIPDDAIPGGSDRNHKVTYIGQVFIPHHGILTTRIHDGQNSVTASRAGVHTSDTFVKILCSDEPDKLTWVPTTAVTLHNDTVGKSLVEGGTENGKTLSIGRIAYQGEVIVGKVCGYNAGSANLYFPYRGEEIVVESYEVLVYSNAY